LRAWQRKAPDVFADGLQAFLMGQHTLEAEAAGLNLAELLNLWGQTMTDGRWGK
jgi:hypothetical protein